MGSGEECWAGVVRGQGRPRGGMLLVGLGPAGAWGATQTLSNWRQGPA